MNNIIFPVETGAIFRDTLFVVRGETKQEVIDSVNKAVDSHISWHPASREEVQKDIEICFWGLWLSYKKTIERLS